MLWHYTNGWSLGEFSTELSISDSYALAEAERTPFISVACSAASKVLTLGLEEGDTCFITNVGSTNAITVKNISGDTGVSVAAGKVAIAIGGSSTSDTSVVYVLN